MSYTVKTPADGVEVPTVSHDIKSSVVNEKPEEIDSQNYLPVEIGQESFGAPPDDEVEYVNNYPVIRSGNSSPQKKFLPLLMLLPTLLLLE